MNMSMEIFNVIKIIVDKTGLSFKVIWAWMIAEEGTQRDTIMPDNNPLNIRYTGNGHPWNTGEPWFANTTGIKNNLVVVYDTPEHGAEAIAALLTGAPQYYQHILDTAGKDDVTQAKAIQDSPWDAGHYNQTDSFEGTIVQLVQTMGDVVLPVPYDTPASSTPETVPTPQAIAPMDDTNIANKAHEITQAYGKIYALLLNQADKDMIHHQANLFRAWLVSVGVGAWEQGDGYQVVKYNDLVI